MGEWKHELLKRLDARDQNQHADNCSDTLSYLTEKIEKLNTRYEDLKSDNLATDLSNALDKIEKLNRQLSRNSEAISEKEMVNNDLLVAYGSAKKDKESIREMYRKLEAKYSILQQELAMNKKTIDVINDHILELQLENNMLHASSNKKE